MSKINTVLRVLEVPNLEEQINELFPTKTAIKKPCLNCKEIHGHNNSFCKAECCREYEEKIKRLKIALKCLPSLKKNKKQIDRLNHFEQIKNFCFEQNLEEKQFKMLLKSYSLTFTGYEI